jgi:hypothetical protein
MKTRLFTTKVLILLFGPLFAQPGTKVKELFRDRYTVTNGNYGHPYSIFDRNNGYSTEQTIQNLRVRLIKESDYQNDMDKPVFLAYKQVYDSAMLPRPVDDGMITYNALGKPTIPSRLALWAKNNAFVMLVGLNGNAYTLSLAERDFVK